MKLNGTAIRRGNAESPVRFVRLDDSLERFRDFYSSIAQRAYEIFAQDGRGAGRDLDHWLQAESQLFHPLHFVMRESDNAVKIRAEVPGFEAKDLEVSVGPRRLAISGRRESGAENTEGSAVYSEQCSDQIFRVLDLPADVDPSRATAKLKHGILELEIAKPAPKKNAEAKKTN